MTNNIVACFAASRYWQDRAELDRAFAGIAARTETPDRAVKLIVDGQGADALQGAKGGTLVIVPMSGAVQRLRRGCWRVQRRARASRLSACAANQRQV